MTSSDHLETLAQTLEATGDYEALFPDHAYRRAWQAFDAQLDGRQAEVVKAIG